MAAGSAIVITSGRHKLPSPQGTKPMTTQHRTSFTKTIIGSTQRLFRSNKNHSLLATNCIDACTARDIGFNPVGQF